MTKQKSKKPTGRIAKLQRRMSDLRARRPHKSFQLTRKQDLPTLQPLPGYFKFTGKVWQTLLKYKKYFLSLLALYVISTVLIVGLSQHEQFNFLVGSMSGLDSGSAGVQMDMVSMVIGLFGIALTGGLNAGLDQGQQFYLLLSTLAFWLITIWMLRHLLASSQIKVRDGLYNGMSPLISTLQIIALMIVQALPAAIGMLIFSLATQMVALDGTFVALFAIVAILLSLLSFYWLTSSVFALLIVTLPGTYPMSAIRAAGDLAVGRRLSLMLRLLWLGLVLLLVWIFIFIPTLVLEGLLNVLGLPFVPFMVQLLTGFGILFGATYVYLLYREMIDERDK